MRHPKISLSEEQIKAVESRRADRELRTAPEEEEDPTPKYRNLLLAAEIEEIKTLIWRYQSDPIWGPFYIEKLQVRLAEAGRHAEQYKRQFADYTRRRLMDHYGVEDIKDLVSLRYDAILQAAKLTRPEKEVLALNDGGRTQAEIARKLKKSQQAISKTMQSMKEKFAAAERELRGPHTRAAHQLTHFADTQGLTRWGLDYIEKHGENPPFCRNCESLYLRKREPKAK